VPDRYVYTPATHAEFQKHFNSTPIGLVLMFIA
jgi:hypothetical protein